MTTYEHTQRVIDMEKILDTTVEVTAQLTQALDRLDSQRETITALCSYYGSADWFTDMDAANNGEVSVKCGVLTEDAPYDAISDIRQNAIRMLEYATDILKAI